MREEERHPHTFVQSADRAHWKQALRLAGLCGYTNQPLALDPVVAITCCERPRRMSSQDVHLVIMQHGLWGVAANLAFVEALINKHAEKHGLQVRVLNSNVNENTSTYDGVDMAGDRVVTLLKSKVKTLADEGFQVTKVSFIGYSLGGLILRYAIGKLEREGLLSTRMTPVNFVTIASPHLGAWRLTPPNSSCIGRAFNSVYHDMVPVISSMTGHQLMLRDEHAFDRPLLMNMSDPGLPFWQGLERFHQRIVLANIRMDSMVPYRSAAICDEDPYLKVPGVLAPEPDKYPSVVQPCSDPAAAQQPADLGRSGFLLVFLLLTPLLIPTLLVVLAVMSFQGKKHYCKSGELRKDVGHSWLERRSSKRQSLDMEAAAPLTDVTDVVLGRVESLRVTMDVANASTLEKQNWMVANLNKLSWRKVDVDPQHRRAHASIVVRNPKQCDKHDHLLYLMDVMKW